MPPIRRPEERIGRTLGRLAAGTLSGTLEGAARPVTPVGEVRTPGGAGAGGGPVFNMSGPVNLSSFDPWPVAKTATFTAWTASLREPGTTATQVELAVNGVAVAGSTITIAAGASSGSLSLVVSVAAGDLLQATVVAAGVSAAGLVVAGG